MAAVRNPVGAAGGLDPEPVTTIRIAAPHAFQRQRRAVTPADYAAAAQEHGDVQRAQATRRWTGSWHTIFLAVDRLGGREVDAAFEASTARPSRQPSPRRTRSRRSCRRISCRSTSRSTSASARITIPATSSATCSTPFPAAIRGGGKPGFFHPDNFTFGDNILLSRIIARGMAVEGVKWIGTKDASGRILGRFGRLDQPDIDYQDTAEIPVAADEVARLDNDPSQPDFGRLRLIMAGGR